MNQPYQVMPPLTPEEFEALKADIAARGLLVAVEKDEHGNILDGHNRARACEELGITDYPVIVRSGLSEEQKTEHALTLNLCRRHLSRDQRVAMVQGLHAQGWSVRRIAQATGFSKSQIARDVQPVPTVPNGTLSAKEQDPLARCEAIIEGALKDLAALSDADFERTTQRAIAQNPRFAEVLPIIREMRSAGGAL